MADTRRYIVHGRVQGVGFRASTQHRARQLSLAGWVCNRADGSVELRASGTTEALDMLHGWLEQGPPAARVERVEATDTAADERLPQPFAVR